MTILDSINLFEIPAEAEEIRPQVREFLMKELAGVPESRKARSWGGYDAGFSRKIAEKGWIGIALPKEYGGGGRSAFTRYVLLEEFLNFGAPVGAHWIADRQSAPLILKYGTEEQKRFHVPAICRGEAFFCIGMSEPEAGSDLAGIRTRAVGNDGGFLLNGRKIWTTNAHRCQYMIALVRTSGGPGDRHKGLSQLIVDLSLPGITIRPIKDLSGDSHFCEVFFDNVQLGHDALIGQEGEGWRQVTAELSLERSGPERLFSSIILLDQWLDWLRASKGHAASSTLLAGKILARLAPLRSMSIAIQSKLTRGESPEVEAALVKELGTTLEQYIPAAIADDIFSREDPRAPGELLLTLQYLTEISPAFSLRGGTREILRGIIARGLGLR